MPRHKITSQVRIDDQWAALQKAINDTLSRESSRYSYDQVSQACSYLVHNGRSDEIFKGLCDILTEYYNNEAQQIKNRSENDLLNAVSDIYSKFLYHCNIFPALYTSYDDKYPGEPNKTKKTMHQIYSSTILSDLDTFNQSITPCIIKVINSNNDVDVSNAKKIINMYYQFKGHKPEILSYFIDKLSEDFKNFGYSYFEDNFEQMSFTQYLENVEEIYQAKSNQISRLLEPEEANIVLKRLFDSIIKSRQSHFLKEDPQTGTPKIAEPLEQSRTAQLKWLIDTYESLGEDIKSIYDICAIHVQNEMKKYQKYFPAYLAHLQDLAKKGIYIDQDTNNDDPNNEEISNDPPYVIISKLMDRATFLMEQYTKVFPGKEAQRKLENFVKLAWNDYLIQSPLHFAQYLDYLITNRLSPNDLRNIHDEEELKIYETMARFFSIFTNKISANTFYAFYYCRRLTLFKSKYDIQEMNVIRTIRRVYSEFMNHLDQFTKCKTESKKFEDGFENYLNSKINDNPQLSTIKNFVKPLVFDNYSLYQLDARIENRLPDPVIEANRQFNEYFHASHVNTDLELQQETSMVELTLSAKIKSKSYSCTVICDLPVGKIIHTMSQRTITFRDFKDILEVPADPSTINNNDPTNIQNNNACDDIARDILRNLYEKGLITRTKKTEIHINDTDEFELNKKFVQKNANNKVFIESFYKKNMYNKLESESRQQKMWDIRRTIRLIMKARHDRITLDQLKTQVQIKCATTGVPEDEEIEEALQSELCNPQHPERIIKEIIENGRVYYIYN